MKFKYILLFFILYLTAVGVISIRYKSDLTRKSYRMARLIRLRKEMWWKRQELKWKVSRLKDPSRIIGKSRLIGIRLDPNNNYPARESSDNSDTTVAITD